jgi:protein-L-isoaspartate(D-aspartate) O-methyltransferase
MIRTLSLLLLIAAVLAAVPAPGQQDRYREERMRMVAQIDAIAGLPRAAVPGDIGQDVLNAMRQVPRHRFVPEAQRPDAYEDRPLPIGYGQTISQPYIVALMTELLQVEPGDTVLEVGTGSGYQAAVLAELTDDVYTIEIIDPLAERAAATLDATGYDEVAVRQGDGYYGWPRHAPFDAIVVTAAASHIPPPLVEQLKPSGRMVIPVGPAFLVQHLMLVERTAEGELRTEVLLPVNFVPLTGGPR